MKILSKKSGIVYKNITLVKFLENGKEEIIDTENVNNIDFQNYDFAYTYLCDDCIKLANKQDDAGCDGGCCLNENCNSSSEVWEITFTKEEIHNDFIIIK